ncbi:hypothetical protein QN277_027168 [Acacia crassicarpa]|uniref:Mitochondrial import receptor subunit TOM22 n=1 Tax=Acacia crassicarpa TaxID=499986 RepID=A0AAE1MLM7_9FABA|nr:hypothetical protein QN277_027168 [Acacia crassicarpa]
MAVLSRILKSYIVQPGKQVALDTAFIAKKLIRSVGKAAWIAGTSFIVLYVPLFMVTDREQQINDLESQQAALLGTGPARPALN